MRKLSWAGISAIKRSQEELAWEAEKAALERVRLLRLENVTPEERKESAELLLHNFLGGWERSAYERAMQQYVGYGYYFRYGDREWEVSNRSARRKMLEGLYRVVTPIHWHTGRATNIFTKQFKPATIAEVIWGIEGLWSPMLAQVIVFKYQPLIARSDGTHGKSKIINNSIVYRQSKRVSTVCT